MEVRREATFEVPRTTIAVKHVARDVDMCGIGRQAEEARIRTGIGERETRTPWRQRTGDGVDGAGAAVGCAVEAGESAGNEDGRLVRADGECVDDSVVGPGRPGDRRPVRRAEPGQSRRRGTVRGEEVATEV